uniref:DNA cytosine methyltransferase n=1 Tax=Podoviridae sp. ctyhm34 TaxID=2826595 RepID=A0A8S5N075_9CAUD|nr:MAG TPA: DNA cytosine methyltransferase [Podoviridae sp. ctyhm34]
MFDEQDRQYFYNEFKNNGYEVGSYDDFKKDLNNEEDRNWYYNEAKNMGYDVGTQADFDKMVLEPAPSTSGGGKQVDASATTQSVEQKASTETKPQVAQPAKKQETTDKDPGLIAKVLDMIPTGVQTSNGTYQPSPEIPQPVVKGEEMPVKEETSSSSSANAASPESKEAAPVTTPTGVVNNEGLMDAKLANYLENWKQRPDKQGDYFENMVADLLADGTANSNEEAVSIVKSALGRYANRSAMDVTNQVVSSLPDDTVQDAEKSIEAQWYSHGVQDKLKQEAYNMGISYDDYVGLFLKPAMVQSLVNKYGPKYRDIAEGIATRLYSHDENVQDRLMNQDINDALSGVISKYVNPSVVDEYNKAQEAGSKAFTEGMEGSQFIPANLRLGTALGAQYEANETKDPAKVLSSLQKKFGRLYRNPEFLNDMSNAAFKVMQRYGLNGTQSSDPKQFKPMINSVLKNELDQLEIKGMMPKGSAEYIMKTGLGNTIVGKITRKAVQTDYQNWLEDIANQQYQPGFWENVASGALTFAGDAWSYWLPGAAGGKLTKSMVAKAEGKLAGDLMAKGMERKMAERAAKVLIGKSKAEALKSGAAHGAVTFGGQSAISKPIDETYRTGQFDENGKIYNPSGWKIALDTLLEGTQQSALGVIMQGNTIANKLGKGRGLATNILADIGGKVVDSGIMTGQQLLERMAHDPNFKPTGKDAAETFLESGANLLSIGFPGFVGKYARFKSAREFNKKFDFTDQDIAELKRFGYDGLRDAFEKVGIGEYAVVGENAQRLDGQLTQKYMDMMNDKSVPEVLKAKMMAVVEGKRPSSFSPIVDSIIIQPMDNDGKVYLETLNKDGGIVERKEFSSLGEAQKADKKLEYEKTLGLASVLEGEFHNEFTQEHLDGLYNKAAQKYNMGEKLTDEDKAAVYLHQNAGAIKEIMDKQQKGIILTDEEQKQVNDYRHYYDSALENSSVMREFVNTFEDSHGVARGTLRKALESKDKKYSPLVESYLKELYNSIELKREMKQIEDDKKRIEQGDVDGAKSATPVEGPASVEGSAGGQEPPVSEEPAPYQDRTNSVPTPSDAEVAANPANSAAEGAGNEPKVASSDAFVMGQNAYKNGDSEALQAIDYNSDLATGRLKRAFADNEKMPDIVANAYNEGRDMEQFVAQRASSLTPAQKEAISKYVEAMDAKNGAIDALQHADDGYGEALKQQLWSYQTEDGNIVPATLDSGKQVFLKKANEYGGAFVVVPDEQGQPTIKQVSNAEIKEVGTPVSLDEYIENTVAQQKDARAQQFISQFDGSGLKPNDQVTVAMEEGDANINMTFAGYSKDGKIVLTDGKDYLSLSKEEFAAWRKNALDNTINEHLDAEDDEREQEAASQAEADKKQRYANGIVGLSEGQPDYSSKDTDPKVAAEYLQEQFGEDHGKLLNLVNGSRDDIKTQLANKRRAAIEYQNWLDTNADLDPEKAKKVEDELSLVNEQLADLDARFKNWNTIRNSVMTPDEVKAMKEERKAEVEKAGIDESAIVPSDDFHVLVLDDKELKKQYPTMDKATDYITSQRKDIYHTQEDVERKINGVNDMLDQYINGETELDPSQLMELNTSKAQLEALQTNLSVAAKGLKAQANKLSRLYKTEVSKQEMEKLGMTPSEQRKALVADALKKNDMNAIHDIYKDASVDVMDLTPQTLEEAVSESLLPHSLNPESLQYELGKSNFKFGIGKGYDSNKFNYLIAKKGTGMSVNEFAVRVYNDLPVNLQDMGYTDQDVRNALLDMFKSYDSVKEMRNVALMNRIAAAEDELSSEEEYYEAQKEREIIERQAEIEQYKSYIHEKELSLPSESELDHINGLEFDRMMEIEDREREYKQYVKSILPELADYDDRSNEEGYGGGSSLGSDSSRRGVDERNSQGEEVGNGEASSESEIGEGSDSGRKGRQETGSMEPGKGSAVRGSHLPQETSFGERLKSAIAETETEITEAQKKAGNYKKGHLSFGGYDYTVETPKGVTRSGKDEQGKPWSVTMHDTYGYILGKIGVDGDHIDMFINDAADLDTFDGNVYVVDQVNPETGEFDEHKVMYGYPSEEAATEAYLANYSKGWKGLGKVTSVPKATFDKWLESSDRKTKPFAEYAMVQKEQAKFDRDVKEVKPSEMTEAQKVAYDAVSTMLKKAGIPVKVVSNEDMEKVAEAQDNLAVEMLLNDPRLRFYIKTPEQKEAAKAAYDWAAKHRPDKFKQYAIVNMDNPNQPPQYFEKKDLAEKWRKYYTNAWKIGNYKAFNLNKPFEEQIKDIKGDVPSEFDPYKAESLLNKRIELEKQIKETEDSYNAKKKERAEYQNQLMQDYMDQHGLSSENDIPDDVWTDYRDKSFEKYQDTLDDLFHKYVELDNQLKAVAEPGVQYLKGKGVVYGYTDGKQIVLNQEHLNPNTPIHEYQHLWRTAAKKMNPELIEHGDKLIMQTQLFADLKQDPNYNHLTDEQICDEAFARLTGEDGAAILEQMAKDAIKENPLDTAKELSVINKLKEWLKKFWYWTLDTFTKWKPEDIKKMTLEDIRNLVLRDLANGVDPRTVMNEKKEGAKLSNKEKDDATERIDKRIAELNRQKKEQSLKSENGNLAESHDNGYLPSKDNLDGVQSVAPSSAKIDKKFPTKTFYLENLANFITSMGKNADITAGNFTKKLFEGMGMTPHGKDTQVSEYFKYQTDDGGKTTVRLSDHSGNALSIIKKGGRADKGYSIVVRVDSSPKTKFKANKYSNVAEYVYENPNADGLKDIARSVFNLIDTGEYLDLAGANEVHVSPRNNDADKTLAGVHNITEEKLRKALKLGGFANPSLAVIDTNKSGHDNFGEISFIAPSALLDKRTGKTAGTWITDAYTQRYPSVEREMSEKGYRKFEDWVNSIDYPSGAKAEIERQAKDALSDNNAPAWELMYLKEKGIDIKEYDSRIDYRWREIISDHPTAEDILNSMKTDPELNEKVTSLAKHAIIHPTWEKVSLEVRRKMYKETGVKASPINPQVRKQTKEIFERDYAPSLLNKNGTPKKSDVKKVVEQMVKEHNDTKKYDFYLSKVKASNYVHKNGLYADYIRWQENKLDEFGTKNRIFRGYKNDGSRKYVPETLENVSKVMREEADGQTNGGEYTSFGSFIAKLASRVDSTSEMRANKEKLSSNKDKEEFYEKWQDVYYDLAKTLYNDVFYGEQRLHDIVSQPDPKKYAKKEYGITLTPSFMKKLDSLKNAVQNELKSAYFETKFNRPVHLNEFVAAVVPNNLGEDVRKGLEESGLSLFDYDPEKEGDRKRAFNEAINSNNEIRFHRVTEPEELDRLNKEKTFRMYSGMQELDGKLYSPMAAIIDGKRTDATEIGAWMGADERPDLVKGGKFQLVKTDKNPGAGEGPVRAAYNPYMHTSTSMMNDQFTGAYARGNIKVVEWEIPESEKTSGYHAEGAKDAVGLVPWHSGSVNGLLPKDRQRSVMLSRWRKAVRVVSDSEVAESIAEQLEGTGLAIPWNVVTPNQVRELVKLGVPITTVESGQQAPETKEKFIAQMEELKKEFPQAQFVDVKMTKEAFKEWGGKGLVKSPILEQKLQKHPDSLMKAGTYFSGGGLVEEGLKGIIDPVVAVEYDRKISGVYRNNFGQHIVTADVRDVDPQQLVKHIDGEVEYFHASPVCKNYSQAKSNSGEVELDKETAKSTADFIDAVKPRVVTIENVKGYKDSEAMKIITRALDKNGYTWDSDVYNAADYGGYTSRERLIVRAVKDGELPEKPKKQPRKGGWLEAVVDILPTLTVKESGVAPWMDARLKADGIDWQKVEKPLYVMGSAYADGKIPHAYGDEILPTLRTKSGDVIIMPGGKVLRADGRVLARITGLGDDYKLPKTESLAHTIIGNGIPVQLTQGVIAPLLNKDDLSGRNVLARLGSSIFKNNWDADKQKQVSDRVVNTANKLGGAEATVYTSVDEVPDAYLSDVKNGATGWYDPTTHTVHVYLPNCADANEAERTVLHEKIGHEGMEVLLGGEDGVRKFANFVYRSVGKDVRGKIIDFANKYDPDWKNSDRMNVGTQEYIAHLAEEGPKTAEDFSLWTKIKHYLIKVLKKLGVRVPGLLNDKDLRYYLMKAGKALHVWDNMPKEKQEAMMKQASNAEIKDALSDGAGKGKPRQKKGESTIQYMKRVQEWRKWQNAREDKENPEPPMFYDIDKDEAGKKEWAQLNKDWRERHHLVGEEPTGMPIRMENEEDDAYMNRIHEYEKWQAAMKDQEDPLPDMFAFEKKKQEEVKRKYEDWLAKHDLLEQQQADLDLYEGKIYPAETNPKADALEQQVMQDLAEVTSTDVSKEGAAMTVKHAVIHRRKNMEEASADDAIYINDVKNRIEKMADSGAFEKLLSDYKGKKNRAEKLAETIPYIIEAPRRLRDMAHNLNATGVFDKGHIHIQPADVEAIQPYVTDLITETAKKHTEIKKGKEIEVYDDPKAVSEVASKMAQAINANHQGEEGFVPCDGTDILSKHVLKLVKERVVPGRINYKELSPEMQAAIDSIRDWYNYTYDWLMDNHTLKAGTGYNVDYVNHIWDKEKSDPEAYATFVENRQRTKSPNEKKRTISTLMEGVYAGLVPKTTDITKMMAYYSRSNIEAWANKTMLQELTGLNVIERNEKGEVISTDPLLSSSAPFNLEQYKYFEIPGVGPVWVYNVSPKQVKVKNPITDNEKVIYSEASAGDRFGVVFDTYQSSPFWKTFDTLASSAKKLELGFSGFHAGALTEVYMVQNMVEFGPKKAMANFMKYIFADTAKNHELPCFANPEDFQEAASHLVKFGATNDYAAADVQNMFDNMRDAMIKVQKKLKDGNKISGTVAKASMPLKVATQMLSLINKGMDVALWDYLHDGLKLATYRMRADKTKERAKKKGWTEEELSRALDEDGQFVNDMFGGQHWDVLGASHRTLRYAGRVLLSPDWNASTTRHFLALTGYGSIWNEATFENFKQYYKRLKHKELTPEDEGRRSRQISALLCYGIGFMVFYEGIANGINAAFRALDEEKERKKAEEIRKTNPSYKSMYELAYGDEGMKWYDYLMRGNSLGQQSKIFLGRYEDGTEMYVRHGKQFREVPEYLFNHKGELEFPGPMVQRMIGKANPMVRMTLDDINYLSDFQASHADQEIQRKYGKTIGLLYKDALYWAPFLIPSQENKEFKAVDFFFPSSKGFSPWKAQSYFKDFILSGDMEGVVMTYQSCQRNGIDPEAQIKAAIGSVKALESAEMSDGVTSLQEASKRFDAAKSITEKKKMRQKMKKFLSQSDYKAFTQKEALDMVQGYLNGDEDLKEMEKAESKYLMKAKAEDVTEDWRIQNVWNGTMETYQEYQRLKDVDKVKANAFKNSKTNKRLFAARKAISAAKRKMNKAKKQMDGTNDAAKLVEIRNTRKELLKTLNGME